jgi:hypothetical protein
MEFLVEMSHEGEFGALECQRYHVVATMRQVSR